MTKKLLKLLAITLIMQLSVIAMCYWPPEWRCYWKLKNHPSIGNINKNISKTTTFSFDEIKIESVKKETDNLDSRKIPTFGGIQPIA